MKILTAESQAMVAGMGHPLAWAVTMTRPDGEVYRYCSGTRNKTIAGGLYIAHPGFSVSNLTCTEGPDVIDSLELTMYAQNDLQKADFLTGRWNGTRVEFNEFDWSAPDNGLIRWPTYRVSDVEPVAGAFVLELRDLRVLWRQNYTLYTGKECQNRLGDYRCQIDLGAWTLPFEITAIDNARQTFTIDLAEAADWATRGYIVLDAGLHLHSGLKLLVLDHATGGEITLAVPLIADVEIGMTGLVTAGCLMRLEDCRDKFDNILNMRAPGVHAPTVEELVGQ